MITTLTGDNLLLIQSALNEQVTSYANKHGSLNIERLDVSENDLEHMTESLVGISLFNPQKLVILKNITGNKQFLDDLEQLLSSVPNSTDVTLVLPNPDKRLKSYKYLKENTAFKEFNELKTPELITWVVNYVKEQGGKLSNNDANYLIERVGNNQLNLAHELDKLLLYQTSIGREQIDELTEAIPQSTIFELMDAAFGGNVQKALKLYDEQREQKVEPLAILGMIGWQLHVLSLVAAAQSKNPSDIAKASKLHPFVVNKSLSIVRRLPLPRLKVLVHRALLLDIRLKSESINADDALKHYILSVMY